MKTEREKFEEWFKEKYSYSAEYFEITKFDESMGFYTANDLYSPDSSIAAWVLRASFESWQAAKADAVPEGFVVVPREPTINQVKAMTDYALGEDAQGFEVGILCGEAKDIYKAMIEAGEKK